MREETKRRIKSFADSIRAGLVKGDKITMLFGEPFDPSDPDSVLVAAVCKAEQDLSQKHAKRTELLASLRD